MSDTPAPWNPNQDEADRLLDEADLASEAEDWKRCEALCRQALALVPDDERACTDLGLVLMEQELFRKAHVYLSTAAASNPTAPIFCLLAHCAIELGRPSECQGLLVQALEVDPDYDEAHCNLGAVLADTDPELARSHFRKALELDPLLTAPLIGLARLARDAGDFEQAIAFAEQAEGIEPDDVQVQELLGQTRYASLIHNKENRSDAEHELCFAATEAALLRAAALDERSPITCSYLGMLHQHFGQQEQAEVWFRKGGELDDIGIFSSLLGEYLADQGRYEEADAFMEQVIERFPDCDYALREFGRCLIRNDRPDQEDHYERATGLFERAVQMDPECPSNLFSLACSWFYGHRSDALKAKELLQRVLELRPNHKGTIECLEEIEEHLEQENSDSPEGPPATD